MNEENFRSLSVFCEWLESWNSISWRNGKLIKETFTALHHTHLCISWTDQILYRRIENAIHITWQISKWSSWGQFDQHWQFSGNQYISIWQVFECEKFFRILSVPGKFQSDHLEAKFDQHWQFSGDQYISIWQVFECEKFFRMLSVLRLNLQFNQKCVKIDFKNLQEPNWDELAE